MIEKGRLGTMRTVSAIVVLKEKKRTNHLDRAILRSILCGNFGGQRV